MPNSYNKGDRPQFNGRFRRIDTGVLYDPTTVRARFFDGRNKNVDRVFGVDPEVIKVSTGWYRVYEPIVSEDCPLYYRFEGFDALGVEMGAGEGMCWQRSSTWG